MAKFRICSIEGCGKIVHARQLCDTHYRQLLKVCPPKKARFSPSQRSNAFWDLLEKETEQCIKFDDLSSNQYLKIRHKGKTVAAHVLACEKRNGPKHHSGLQASHSCGVKSCFNPAHLRWATPIENNLDKKKHGTYLFGETSNSPLTNEDVLQIRIKRKNGLALKEIGDFYNVSKSAIYSIVHRKTWKHI